MGAGDAASRAAKARRSARRKSSCNAMSEYDDLHGVTQPPIPDDAVEQLLHGTWTGSDGSEDLAHVAEIFRAARASGDATELASLAATVAAFRHEVGAPVIELTTARKRPMFKKYLTAKT